MVWCSLRDSNPRYSRCKRDALAAELSERGDVAPRGEAASPGFGPGTHHANVESNDLGGPHISTTPNSHPPATWPASDATSPLGADKR